MTDSHHSILVLRGIGIKQDEGGRFCLNDLHHASGGNPAKRPGVWRENIQTKELIAAVTDAGIPASPISIKRGGVLQGTYAVRELVYAYAMWISPAFHLAVIRAFDASQQENASRSIPQQATPTPAQAQPPIRFRSMDSAFRQMMKVALLCGVPRRVAMERAAEAVKRHWGVNPLHAMGLTAEPLAGDGLFDRLERERGHE
ncbi:MULTISPECIES: KilA-N domain-containing protein [unclassified Saccharibacter]|uniref:KilA-N domain-containing protein n=1 Tax=unclassified Saccharibacter TaxID=2648722 RepID=UPI00132C2EBA|nr:MULTISPECIES: KilA-N domain-containing protein [unclassified Saccharibacter]MXV35818.1 hypothetical protein [Saccharibacter sp. EH611]MXV57939.1 hypothetical protein [Saccharibacter sp. EH70]MXV66334.1 hypothetical protein [Saccharibacter sp. EH60]